MLTLQFRLKAQFLLARYDITVEAQTELRSNLTAKLADADLEIIGFGGDIIELLFQGTIDELKADREGFSTFLLPVEIDHEHPRGRCGFHLTPDECKELVESGRLVERPASASMRSEVAP